VTIDIIRRDTLAASHAITSPLRRLAPHHPAINGRDLADTAAEPAAGHH
jgi:hypothetical protein